MLQTLALADDDVLKDVLFAIGGGVAMLWIIMATVHAITRDRMREGRTREVAAYMAEGSMTPEQGERLLKAKPEESD